MDPQTMTAAQATKERDQLMSNREFTAQAMNVKSQEWQRLTELNRTIAGEDQAGESAASDPMLRNAQVEPDPMEIPEGAFAPPESPSRYDLPTTEAKRMGLDVDAEADMELRQSLHAAGVDNALASALYMASAHAAKQDLDPASVASARFSAENSLRRDWGGSYDANLQAAKSEAVRIFEKLPASVTQGATFEEFALVTGLGNNPAAIRMLAQRARARQS